MANDATNSPSLMVMDMESYRTTHTEPTATMSKRRLRGVVGNVTAPGTPGHNSRRSADERMRLERIRADRMRGFMVSAPDVDFLLEVIARVEA